MAYKVIWSPEALRTFLAIIEYLEREWSEKEIKTFTARVLEKIEVLQVYPKHGRRSNKKKNYFRTVLNKRVTLVYQLKPSKQEIQLLTFWNNWQNTKK